MCFGLCALLDSEVIVSVVPSPQSTTNDAFGRFFKENGISATLASEVVADVLTVIFQKYRFLFMNFPCHVVPLSIVQSSV